MIGVVKDMTGLIENFGGFIIHIINALGYWGIIAGMFLESACIPIPSELILPTAGVLVANNTITMLGANIAVAAGSLLGSLTAYFVGYYGGRPFILKYGKYFFVSEKHFYKADKTFNKYGSATVFFGRLLPIIRTFISLPAGIARMDLRKFIAYSLIGMVPWNFTLIYLGKTYGDLYKKKISPIFHKFDYIVIIGIIAIILIFIIKHLVDRNKKEVSE